MLTVGYENKLGHFVKIQCRDQSHVHEVSKRIRASGVAKTYLSMVTYEYAQYLRERNAYMRRVNNF